MATNAALGRWRSSLFDHRAAMSLPYARAGRRNEQHFLCSSAYAHLIPKTL